MSSKWALVTGANGFLGARLVRQLVARGERVKALVRAGANLRELEGLPHDQVKIANGDVRVCDRVYAAMSGCDRLYHVAATFSINERNRGGIFADAVEGTTQTLEAARRAGLRKIVVTSSVGTLGTTKTPESMDEGRSLDLKDANAYVAAKVAAERVAVERAEAGAPITIVNPAIMVGPGDWKPTPSGQQIVNYLGFSPSLRMPWPPGGFSYADVDDVALGHIAAMDKGRIGERYILGGENLTNRELFQLLSDVTGLSEPGKELSHTKMSVMAGLAELYAAWTNEAPVLSRKVVEDYFGTFVYVSSDKAKKELGYEPRAAREGLIRSCRWFIDQGYVSKQAARRARLELQPA